MILIGLGGNLEGPWGSPPQTMREAIHRLCSDGSNLQRRSGLVETAPLGPADQPNFLNAVISIRTVRGPEELLSRLQEIERAAGRRPGTHWGPRPLDLDLLDYHGLRRSSALLTLPHPGLASRAFVLVPIAEIAPRWRHPATGETAHELLAQLPDQTPGRVLAERAW